MQPPSIPLANGHAAINSLTILDFEIEPHLPAHLTQEEEQDFFHEETIVRNSMASIWELGRALKRIRDQKYYRKYCPTFEAYLQQRWDFGPSYCSRIIVATEVVNYIGSHVPHIDLPANEWQVRPLLGLPPETASLAWKQALEQADGEPVTATLVKEAVSKLIPTEKKPRKPSRPKWARIVQEAKASLKNLTAAEDAVKNDQNLEAGLKSLAKLRPFLELLAKQ